MEQRIYIFNSCEENGALKKTRYSGRIIFPHVCKGLPRFCKRLLVETIFCYMKCMHSIRKSDLHPSSYVQIVKTKICSQTLHILIWPFEEFIILSFLKITKGLVLYFNSFSQQFCPAQQLRYDVLDLNCSFSMLRIELLLEAVYFKYITS